MYTHILVMTHTHLVVLFQAFHNWMGKLEKGVGVGDSRERKASTHSSQVTADGLKTKEERENLSKASVLQCSVFFIVQLSHPYITTGKTIALTRRTFVGKVMFLLFIYLFIFVSAF